MSPVALAIVLFLSGALADVFWAYYLSNMASADRTGDRAYRRKAAFWSVQLGLCSWFMVDGMMTDKMLTLVWLVGLWCGTYYAHPIRQFFQRMTT